MRHIALPSLGTLHAVVPVAQTHVREGVAATLTSIECYSNGWLVHYVVYGAASG